MVMRREKSDYSIQAVDNVFRLLEEFDADEEIGVTELAERLRLHKNNVFRILATLTTRGYVEKNEETDRYRLGPACLVLGQAYSRRRSLLVQARRSLRRRRKPTSALLPQQRVRWPRRKQRRSVQVWLHRFPQLIR